MLFSKKIEKRCAVCQYSKKINDNEAICDRHGVVNLGYRCRKFVYDATKRIPPEEVLLKADSFSKEDFSL